MRLIPFCHILQFLFIIALHATSTSTLLSVSPKKHNSIRCFNQQREVASLQTEIHIDCNNLWTHSPCLSNTTNIFNWLSEFYPNVTSLHLEENCITDVPELPYLPNMILLKYRHNKIKQIEDGAFNFLPTLNVLDLSHNLLTEIRPNIFKGNNSTNNGPLPIKSLHLGFNKIKSINKEMFDRLSSLQELHLDGNPLQVIDSSTAMAIKYTGRQSLEVLNLAKTDISSIPLDFFAGSKIKILYINGNNFYEVPQELINLRETLEFLNINENPITVLNSESFFALDRLKEIVAAGMENLTDVNGGTFLHLNSLEQLTLSFNPRLSFIDQNAFCIDSCSSTPKMIKIVYLNHNNLHYLPEELLPWNQLEMLSLSSNPWKCDWKNQWMIKLKIEWNHTITDSLPDICSQDWIPQTGCNNEQSSGCIKNKDYYLRRKLNVPLDTILLLSFIASIFFLISAVLLKLISANYSKRIPISDISVLSSSLRYNKLVNKPSYEI